jgi:DeoR family transcriptional regulator, fructose operon transcriptional repressor
VVLLADHGKVGNDCVCPLRGIEEVDMFITDAGLGDEAAEELSAAGVRVIRA